LSSNDAAIGVFDSGIGGLTVVSEINRRLPHERIIYLGDTARLPFGSKSPVTIQRYSLQIADFLLSQNIKALVIACNTASAWALDQVSSHSPVPVLGVINAGCGVAVEATVNGRIGVIGTQATIQSQAYAAGIRRSMPEAVVVSKSCPLFVPLVEEGWLEGSITTSVVREYCAEVKGRGVDTLVLGCTHYPLLSGALQQYFGADVSLVSSSKALALELEALLRRRDLLSCRETQSDNAYFLTDHSAAMHRIIELFLGEESPQVTQVDIPAAS